jgi:hypothetical protein|tara:strand:- start:424 stop:636 length:213 start_codon:yes stop_codon:yes gene_type:complete
MLQSHSLPDARDGLSENERIILYCLHLLEHELKKDFVPTIMLYGRVSEFINISERELISTLQRFGKMPFA